MVYNNFAGKKDKNIWSSLLTDLKGISAGKEKQKHMPKQIDKLKLIKYKEARKQGKSKAQALRDSGYSEQTALHKNSSSTGVVKVGEEQLMAEVKASDISVDWVVSKLNQELQSIHAKSSDRVRILELLGKYLNMFRDANNTQVNVFTRDMLTDLPPLPVDNSNPPIDVEPLTQTPNNVGVTTS